MNDRTGHVHIHGTYTTHYQIKIGSRERLRRKLKITRIEQNGVHKLNRL